ncbi:MAG: urease accessory protein UreF [Burkholderiaceae bacterium]|jgi:urease accessory protein|nr:urease accessory protein UreF [Burkholderiales bacterium]MCZ8100790.1 urease accessory protein UreF [Burkholderiales bacterium]MCZ8339936.1 urease accessory protein UreF [Burkholderiaceae bacterium]
MSVSASIALLQLASPALPIGGYSYSTALEWGVDVGAVRDETGAREWIADALALSIASFEGPLAREAMRAAARWPAADAAEVLESLNVAAIAARETAELRLESEQMGYSLGRWLEAVCPDPESDAWIAARLSPLALPVGWAIAATRLGLAERDALLGLFWAFAENQAMVLMKAVPMGQIAAQRLLRSLAPELEAAVGRALALPREAWSSAAPGLAIASARHETQYSRLFRS